jgi:DNA mismatch repair protein MutL
MGEDMTSPSETGARAAIRRLPPEVVGRIAAGEMIARPAAAVKELIENALDAGAQRIVIRVTEALDRYLEVADDGCGIPAEDVGLALERYTTSKIRGEEDLLAVATLGFRGEALASIAEIARVTLVSRMAVAEHAWQVRAEAGHVGPPEAASRATGTTVIVEDLFFNTPVRKRFLKKGPGEWRVARETIQAYGLASPGIAWHVELDGREVIDLPPAPDLRTRLVRLHGPRVADSLLEVEVEEDSLALKGFVGSPELARGGSHHQAFFVNGRWVASPWLAQAVRQAFGDLLPGHQAPWAVLFLTLPPDQVDVNLHPTKREVRFLDERRVFSFVQRAVRPAVARLLPRFFLGHTDDASARGGLGSMPASPGLAAAPSFDGIEETRRLYGRTLDAGEGGAYAAAPATSPAFERESLPLEPGEAVADRAPLGEDGARGLISLWQLHQRYVLAQTRKGLLLIDQHAAHERVLYERVLDRMQREPSDAQQLLFPIVLELTEEEMELYRELEPDLTRMGFDCEAFEEHSLVVRGVPPLWHARSEGSLVRDLLDEARELGLRSGATAEGLARAFACRAAIKAGDPLTMEEMNRLVDELFATRVPHGDPHGRPTFVFIALADLDRRFGRSS